MCGLFALQDSQAIDLSILPAVFASMQHRGPNDENYYHHSGLLMCHSRLAIESKPEERQPLISQDQRYIVIVNGELYPYKQLRKKMESIGYIFQTDSDSELALALYTYYGEEFVHHLRGEFALVIKDTYEDKLIAVRDRFGIKPLLYAEQNNRWYFSSEAKTLFAAGLDSGWNKQGLMQCLSYQYLLPGYSLFAGIKQLPPGHLLILKDNTAKITPYWKMQFTNTNASKIQPKTKSALEEEILYQLKEAIQIRIPRTQPCAFSLSGGLDSSAVVTIAQEFLNSSPECYSVSFDHQDYDEYELARQYAEQQGYTLNKVNVSTDDLINYIDDAAYYSEGLAGNGQYVGKYLLNRAMAKDGYHVVMSGEGADEAFMGYAHLLQDYATHELNNEQQAQALQHISHTHHLQSNLMLGSSNSIEKNTNTPITPSFLAAKFRFCKQFLPLLQAEFTREFNQESLQKERLKQLPELSVTQRANILWKEMVLGNYILKTLGDGMEMAFSIEGRLPFLDHKLFELACSIDTHLKIDGLQSKKILRQSLRSVLPKQIIQREKHPFIAPPIQKNISPQGMDKIFDTLNSQAFKNNPVFEPNRVLTWLSSWKENMTSSNHTASGAAKDPIIMMLLSFCALQNQFTLNTID